MRRKNPHFGILISLAIAVALFPMALRAIADSDSNHANTIEELLSDGADDEGPAAATNAGDSQPSDVPADVSTLVSISTALPPASVMPHDEFVAHLGEPANLARIVLSTPQAAPMTWDASYEAGPSVPAKLNLAHTLVPEPQGLALAILAILSLLAIGLERRRRAGRQASIR